MKIQLFYLYSHSLKKLLNITGEKDLDPSGLPLCTPPFVFSLRNYSFLSLSGLHHSELSSFRRIYLSSPKIPFILKQSVIPVCILFFVVLFGLGCKNKIPVSISQTPAPHAIWDSLLQRWVNSEGGVNYKGFIKDSLRLNQYLGLLATHPPSPGWSREEKMAYWINAYNAFTIQLILRHYPLKSIKDISSGPIIPFVHSPWDIRFIILGGQKYDLNKIEHEMLRRDFNDPRIHFAINCASRSCPALANEAYKAEILNHQLDLSSQKFLNDTSKNKISQDPLYLSKIFSWYKGDFTRNGESVVDFISKYSRRDIQPQISIEYLDYDWSLNDSTF